MPITKLRHICNICCILSLCCWCHYKTFYLATSALQNFCYFVTLALQMFCYPCYLVTLTITKLLLLFELCLLLLPLTPWQVLQICYFDAPWHYKTFVTFCYFVTLALKTFCYFCYFAALLLTLLPDFACFVTHFACLVPSPSLPAPPDPAIQMACLRFSCLRCLLSCLAMFFCGRVFSNSKIKPKRDIVDTKRHAFCAFWYTCSNHSPFPTTWEGNTGWSERAKRQEGMRVLGQKLLHEKMKVTWGVRRLVPALLHAVWNSV